MRAARFGIPEPSAGFIPSQILPLIARRIGEGTTRELAVTDRIMDATEALPRRRPPSAASHRRHRPQGACAPLDDVLRLEPAALAIAKRLVLSCATGEMEPVLDDAAAPWSACCAGRSGRRRIGVPGKEVSAVDSLAGGIG